MTGRPLRWKLRGDRIGTALIALIGRLTQLRRDHHVDDEIYGKAVDKFGENGVMDLIAVSGYYDVVSMTLNVAHVAPPADAQLPFKQAGR